MLKNYFTKYKRAKLIIFFIRDNNELLVLFLRICPRVIKSAHLSNNWNFIILHKKIF